MNPFASLVGIAAETNAALSRQSINAVPVNFIIMGFLLLLSYFCGGMVVSDHTYVAVLGFIPAFGLFCLLLVSTFKLNTFFVRSSANKGPAAFSGGAARATNNSEPLPPRLNFTGKLRLDPKSERRFLNMPAQAIRLENGQLAFASNIDASTRLYGAVMQSRVGIWLSLPELQTATFETGTLLCGKTPSPAVRMRYQETSGQKSKNAVAILGFASQAERDSLLAFLRGHATAGAPLQSPPALT